MVMSLASVDWVWERLCTLSSTALACCRKYSFLGFRGRHFTFFGGSPIKICVWPLSKAWATSAEPSTTMANGLPSSLSVQWLGKRYLWFAALSPPRDLLHSTYWMLVWDLFCTDPREKGGTEIASSSRMSVEVARPSLSFIHNCFYAVDLYVSGPLNGNIIISKPNLVPLNGWKRNKRFLFSANSYCQLAILSEAGI